MGGQLEAKSILMRRAFQVKGDIIIQEFHAGMVASLVVANSSTSNMKQKIAGDGRGINFRQATHRYLI